MIHGFVQLPVLRPLPARPIPLKVNIVTNYACNLRCVYCDVASLDKRAMTTRQLAQMIEELAQMGMRQANFIGGEPFLRRDLVELLAEAKHHGVSTVVHSNGIFVRELDPRVFDSVDLFITCVNGRREAHEHTRGAGTYARALESIRLFRAHGVRVVADMVLSRHNAREDEVGHALGLAAAHGYRVNFQPVFEHQLVNAAEAKVAGITPAQHELQRIFRFLLEQYDPEVMLNSQSYLADMADEGVSRFRECYMGVLSCAVDPRGNVARCFQYLQRPGNPNGLELGWRRAVEEVRLTDCVTCRYSTHIEDNYAILARAAAAPPALAGAAP